MALTAWSILNSNDAQKRLWIYILQVLCYSEWRVERK
jgi:hypothetical protein